MDHQIVARSSDSLMSASHQADVRLEPGCVAYPILVQQGYMAVQHGYMAIQQCYMEVQQGYMAVQQGYMLDKLSTNEKPRSIVPESSRPIG